MTAREAVSFKGAGRGRIAAVVAAAALALACSHGEREEEKGPPEPASVRTAKAEAATLVERITVAGRIAPLPDRDADLAPLVAGRLTSVEVRQGDAVRKGQVLARVESASLADAARASEAAERRAQADAEFHKKSAARSRSLFEKGVSTLEQAEADESAAVAAEASHAEAVAALAEARRRLTWSELRAPFDGVVLHVARGPGAMVDGTPATPVMEIAGPDPVEIAADVGAAALAKLAVGDEAAVRPVGGEPVTARIARLAPSVDPATGVGEIRLRVDKSASSPRLVLGATVEVVIRTGERRVKVAVPGSALRRTPEGGSEVVVVDQGTARVRSVETGVEGEAMVEIRSGLDGGEEVIVDDPVGIGDGTPVRATP